MSDPEERASRLQIERKLEAFIVEELVEELHDGSDPLAAGVVDSLGIEQLLGYVEDEFGVAFADEDLRAENFESIPTLAALVESKGGAPAA